MICPGLYHFHARKEQPQQLSRVSITYKTVLQKHLL